MPRIVTYNVHRCVGTDRRLDVGRVAAVIGALNADIVALQEVDVGRMRTGHVDQAHEIARHLRMAFHFHPAMAVEEELYGDAILTSLPERPVKTGPLPGHPRIRQLEPRGALWIEVEIGGRKVQVINTHLGLVPREQQVQARALAGPQWLGDARAQGPLLLVGDFNATPNTGVYRTLTDRLDCARKLAPVRNPTATFPSTFPVVRIDHVFTSPGIRVSNVSVPSDALTRVASDHLPLVVDFEVDAGD